MKELLVREYKRNPNHGHLVAFVVIETPSGLIINDCRLFEKGGRQWIGLPSRQYKKADGSTGYAQIIDFASKEAAARFQDEAIRAVDAYLAGGGHGE